MKAQKAAHLWSTNDIASARNAVREVLLGIQRYREEDAIVLASSGAALKRSLDNLLICVPRYP